MNNKLLSRNYILLLVSSALFYTASFMINTVIVRFVTDSGSSVTVAGLVTAVFTLASFFTRPVWGYICDRYGRKPVYIVGAVSGGAASVILLFNTGIFMLVISRIIFGAGYSALTTAGSTVVCDISPPDRLQQSLATYGVTNVFSQAVAPVVALWLYKLDFMWVAATVAILCGLVIAAAIFVKYNQEKFINPHRKFMLYHSQALPATYTIVFFAMATASVNSFIPLLAQRRQLTADSMFFIISAVFLLVTRLANKKLVAAVGNIKLFYTGTAIYMAAFVILAMVCTNMLLLIGAALYGIGSGLIHPIVNTASVKDCREASRGLATGTFMMGQDLGMALGAYAWGAVNNFAGFGAVYICIAVVLVIMSAVFRHYLTPVVE